MGFGWLHYHNRTDLNISIRNVYARLWSDMRPVGIDIRHSILRSQWCHQAARSINLPLRCRSTRAPRKRSSWATRPTTPTSSRRPHLEISCCSCPAAANCCKTAATAACLGRNRRRSRTSTTASSRLKGRSPFGIRETYRPALGGRSRTW